MLSFARELVAIDRDHVDFRAGVLGVVVVAVFGAAVALIGPVAIAAAIGALVVLATDPPPAGRSLATALVPLAAGGTVVTFLAVWIGDRALPAALVAGVVSTVATLHAGTSRKAGVRALVTTLWIIVALTLHDTDDGPLAYAAAFAVGAVAGTALALLRARSGSVDETSADDHEDGTTAVAQPTVAATLASPLGQFALLRGIGLATAVLVGFTLFPDHPAWVAITVLIVTRPPTRQALVVGLQRSVGTGVGVIVAVAVAEAIGDNRPGLVILFLVSAFLMMAVRDVNYALFAVVVTALVIYIQRILGADAAESGRDRLVETVLGVAIAFAVLALTEALGRARRPTPWCSRRCGR